MIGMKERLESRLDNARMWRCWRVVCARIRDIAKMQMAHGIPYEQTLREYNYEFYHKRIKD